MGMCVSMASLVSELFTFTNPAHELLSVPCSWLYWISFFASASHTHHAWCITHHSSLKLVWFTHHTLLQLEGMVCVWDKHNAYYIQYCFTWNVCCYGDVCCQVSLVSELYTLIFYKSSTLVIVSGLFMIVLQFSNYLCTSLSHHSLLQPVRQTHITLLQLEGMVCVRRTSCYCVLHGIQGTP